MRSSLPPLGTWAGGTDVHSCDLSDWGQRRDHLHTGAGGVEGGGLSLAKTSTSSASPPESTGPRMARADYLTFATRRKMKCYRERCLSL